MVLGHDAQFLDSHSFSMTRADPKVHSLGTEMRGREDSITLSMTRSDPKARCLETVL